MHTQIHRLVRERRDSVAWLAWVFLPRPLTFFRNVFGTWLVSNCWTRRCLNHSYAARTSPLWTSERENPPRQRKGKLIPIIIALSLQCNAQYNARTRADETIFIARKEKRSSRALCGHDITGATIAGRTKKRKSINEMHLVATMFEKRDEKISRVFRVIIIINFIAGHGFQVENYTNWIPDDVILGIFQSLNTKLWYINILI